MMSSEESQGAAIYRLAMFVFFFPWSCTEVDINSYRASLLIGIGFLLYVINVLQGQ